LCCALITHSCMSFYSNKSWFVDSLSARLSQQTMNGCR
jgi:hypothetical protein